MTRPEVVRAGIGSRTLKVNKLADWIDTFDLQTHGSLDGALHPHPDELGIDTLGDGEEDVFDDDNDDDDDDDDDDTDALSSSPSIPDDVCFPTSLCISTDSHPAGYRFRLYVRASFICSHSGRPGKCHQRRYACFAGRYKQLLVACANRQGPFGR
jgi:hypothetical protein